LQNGHDARRLLWACLNEDTMGGRSLERAIVKGLVDGNPPYNDAKKNSEGRGWECNLNFMEGQAIMDSSAVPYFALFANVPYFADCCPRYVDNPDFTTWKAKITSGFTNLLKRWPQFNWNIQQVSYWMRLHGIGPAFFDREGDWRFRGLETGNVLVPKGSPSCIDDRLPFIIIRMPYRIVELYDWIKDPDAAEKAGCNVEAIRNAIMYGMKGLAPSGALWWAQGWEYYERILANNDLTVSYTDADLVFCSHILVQEFAKTGPKKISRFIFTENEVVSRGSQLDVNKNEKDKSFLFADPNSYDSFTQCLVAFFQNTGDGTWHSVRGLAMKAFKHLEVSNRLKCQTVNRAFLDSSLIIQSGSARNQERISLTVWGSVVRVPANGEIKPITVQGGTQGVMEVDRMLTNHLANNIGMFNQRTLSREDGKGEQPTATQINQQVAKESTLSEGQITLFYQYLDTLYTEMFRRAADPSTSDSEAKRFQKELFEQGVPKEALKNMEYVRANRQSGYGSPQMALLKMQQGLPIVPMLPEQGKLNWLEDNITTIYGPEKTERYVPEEYVPNQDASIAALENGLITQGIPPLISSGQDDVVHLHTHFEFLQQLLGPVSQAIEEEQQLPPEQLQDAYKTSQTAIPHMEAHIGRIQNDPMRKGQAKLFQDQLRQLTAFDGKLRASLYQAIRDQQVQAEQAQQASSLSALDQAKVQSIQTQTQLAAQKTQSQIENQTAKTIHGLRLKSLKQGQDMNLNLTRTAQELNLNAAKTAADIRNQKAKAVAVPKELTEAA
jgi:hypothetical protein